MDTYMRRMHDGVKKMTDNRFLNMYEADGIDREGKHFPYYFVTRRDEQHMEFHAREFQVDGVVMYALMEDDPGKIVLVRQYRYPFNDYLYELPAGLVDAGEDGDSTAIREMKEETGLDFSIYEGGSSACRRVFAQAQGLADECDQIVFGYARGDISLAENESQEEIEVVIADKATAKRILETEKVSIRAAFLLMHFLKSDVKEPFAFLDI